MSLVAAGCSPYQLPMQGHFQCKAIADFHLCISQKSTQQRMWNVLHYEEEKKKVEFNDLVL